MGAIPITETREPSLANRLGGRLAIVLRDKRFLICGMALVGILLSSCALFKLMNEKECLNADWDVIGFEDGAGGDPFDRFNRRRKDCAEYSVVAKLNQYQTGRQRGLEQVYCTKQKGIEEGLKGRTYQYVCPANLEPDFLAGYEPAIEVFKVTEEIREVEDEMERVDHEIEEVRERLMDPDLSAESREILFDHLADLSRDAARLEISLEDLQTQLETLEERL